MDEIAKGTLRSMLDKLPPSSSGDADSATFGVDQTESLLTVPINDLDGELLEIIPHKDNDGIEDGVNLLQSLHDVRIEGGENVSQPHSFEVWYDRGEFHFFLEAATERARDRFQRRVSNVYPDAEVNPVDDGVGFPVVEPEMHRAGGWLKEQRHTFLPIKHHNAEGFETGDPYSDILGQMATLDNSLVVLQVIFKPAHPEWTHKGPDGARVEDIAHDLRSSDIEDLTRLSAWNPLREPEEKPATKKDKQAAQIVEEQRGRQGFHANIRVLAASPDRYEAEERVRGTTSMFAKYYNSQTEQGLRAHGVAAADVERFYGSCVTREWIDRSMILSIDELAGIAHIPSGDIEVPGIQWRHSKTGSDAPSTAPKDEVSESRNYSYSSQSGVSGGNDESLSPTEDSRPTQTEPDAGSLLALAESDANPPTEQSAKTGPETVSPTTSDPPTGSTEREQSGDDAVNNSEPDPDDATSTESTTETHTSHSDRLLVNPDAYTDHAAGGEWSETPRINKQRAAELADMAAEEWDSDGDPDEAFLRMVARGALPTVSEKNTVKGQPAEYAVVDQYNKRHEPMYERRADDTSNLEYVAPDGTDSAPAETDSAPAETDSAPAETDSAPAETDSATPPEIPISEIPAEFTVDDCPGCDAPRTYTQITLGDEKRWICESCGATLEPRAIPKYIDIQPAESESQSEEDTDDMPRPVGMDRVQITPADELFAEYVELLIASIPPDKQDQITAETTVRELIATIRELEAADELVPLSTGVLENTRPDTLSKDDVLSEGTVKLPSEMGVDVGNDGLADRPIDALDVDPGEVEARGMPQVDRTPTPADSSEPPSPATTEPAETSGSTSDTESHTQSDPPAETQAVSDESDPQDSSTPAANSSPTTETNTSTPDSDAEIPPSPTDTAESDDGAWWGHADPEHTTVEATSAATTDAWPHHTPFDDEWVDDADDAADAAGSVDPEDAHRPETERHIDSPN